MAGQRRRQQLGRHGPRRGARARVRADRIGGARLPRRRPRRRQPVRQLRAGARRRHRAEASGTSRRCITTSGIATSRRRRRWSPSVATAGQIDAVAQTTKQGFVFVLDRETGAPLFPVDEQPVPASTVPGERASRTQPVPRLPEPFARQRLTADLLTRRTPEAHAWAAAEFARLHTEGSFTPLRVGQDTVVFPGFDGGAEWGGSAYDPRLGAAVRQRQRPGVDRRAGARRRRHRRPRPLPEVVRELPPRRSPRRAAADSGAHQPHRVRRAV